MYRKYLMALSCLVGLLLSACDGVTPLPPPPVATASPPPPAFVLTRTAETLSELVLAERDASIQRDLPLLAMLWAEEGRIVDGRGSAETHDDYVWAGRAAILDRYELAVFPAPPPPLTVAELADATLNVEADHATFVNGGDRWRFIWQEGRWWLAELVYSSPAQD